LQRLTRLRRLARQIAASLPVDFLDDDQAERSGDRPVTARPSRWASPPDLLAGRHPAAN
jgi:hypothetical protein